MLPSTVVVTTQPPRVLLQFGVYGTILTHFPEVENAPVFAKKEAAVIPVLIKAFSHRTIFLKKILLI